MNPDYIKRLLHNDEWHEQLLSSQVYGKIHHRLTKTQMIILEDKCGGLIDKVIAYNLKWSLVALRAELRKIRRAFKDDCFKGWDETRLKRAIQKGYSKNEMV